MSEKVVRSMGVVSFATLLSRILGYARDALVAHAFGGGAMTDAFYAAFRIPNLLRRVLGEGPLTSAFVPVFSAELAKGRKKDAQDFFRAVFGTLGGVLSVLVIIGILAAPLLVGLVAWGFKSDPAKFALTVDLTRLTFPFVLFVCLAAVSAGALNALGYFFVPALAPAMLSVAEIAFVLFLMGQFANPLYGLAASAAVGGFLHFAVMVPLMRREGLSPRPGWSPRDPRVLSVASAILPAVWGLSVDQVNAFVDTVCASFLVDGSVTALYNSNRLMQFPLALFGIAMSTAALPSLSLSAAKGDWDELRGTLSTGLRVVFFAVVPAMAGLIVLGRPAVELLFEHGRFTRAETLLTAGALAGYALGLPAFAAVKILVSAFYAMKDVRTPVRVATLCVVVNIAGCLSLMGPLGVTGLALATSLASTLNAALLFWKMRSRLGGRIDGRRMLTSFLKALAASAALAAGVHAFMTATEGSLLWRVPAAVGAGMVLYAVLSFLLRSEEMGLLWKRLARK